MTTQFDTNQPAQIQGIQGYTVDPIFTVGETINGYTPTGILDGTGAFELNETTVRVLVNSEIGSSAGYAYTLENGTSLTGSRIHYFDIDKATLKIVDSGLAYDKIYNRAGEVVDEASDLEFEGIQRFCAANLMEANQFGAGMGFADTIYFAGEETDGGTEFALDVQTNELWALPWLGRAAWESVTELDTGSMDKVALLVGDDRGPAPLILYIGNKNVKNDGSFLDRNGLGDGKLYVWVADDPTDATDPIEANAKEFAGSGNMTGGKFVEIDYYRPDLAGTADYDTLGFATQEKQDLLAADVQAFLFSRPEDVATNPFDGTQAVLASTGRTGLFDDADTWGTTYRIDVDFNNIDGGDISAKIDILYDGNDEGNKDFGLRSPDNLDWADNGKIYLQEDRAISSSLFGATSGEEASIWSIDPFAANPAATATRVAQIDRSGVPSDQTDPNPTDIGNWESSGILDVSTLFGNAPGTQFIYDIQAHSLRDGNIINVPGIDGNGDGTVSRNENLVEGGQLGFLIAPNANLIQNSSLFLGSTTSDDYVEAIRTEGFDGVNDIVFTGTGDDTVDSTTGGALPSGNNIIDTGTGNDTTFLANGDLAFGSDGDDTFYAYGAKNYRASGGADNDTFYLGDGSNGSALGGDGNDEFYAGLGGGNFLSGGAGSDQFWIFNAEAPKAANTVLDFQIGTDVIGISGAAGLGITTSTLKLNQIGNDTAIVFGDQTIATLSGIQASFLNVANTNQFLLV